MVQPDHHEQDSNGLFRFPFKHAPQEPVGLKDEAAANLSGRVWAVHISPLCRSIEQLVIDKMTKSIIIPSNFSCDFLSQTDSLGARILAMQTYTL
jgi:hypothetical protein